MQYPFMMLPKIRQLEAKNFTVLKISGTTGKPVRTLMVYLTRTEAEGVARAGNRWYTKKGITDYYRVLEEKV